MTSRISYFWLRATGLLHTFALVVPIHWHAGKYITNWVKVAFITVVTDFTVEYLGPSRRRTVGPAAFGPTASATVKTSRTVQVRNAYRGRLSTCIFYSTVYNANCAVRALTIPNGFFKPFVVPTSSATVAHLPIKRVQTWYTVNGWMATEPRCTFATDWPKGRGSPVRILYILNRGGLSPPTFAKDVGILRRVKSGRRVIASVAGPYSFADAVARVVFREMWRTGVTVRTGVTSVTAAGSPAVHEVVAFPMATTDGRQPGAFRTVDAVITSGTLTDV